jgi:outer membrane receptor protein involved in Fe transport
MKKWIFLLFPVLVNAQNTVTVSGQLKDAKNKSVLAYVNIVISAGRDTSFVAGTISSEDGRFVIAGIKSGSYLLTANYNGYITHRQDMVIGNLSQYLDLGIIELKEDPKVLAEVTVSTTRTKDGVSDRMDKKVFTLANNPAQAGGSVLQAMQNLPGVTVQDGKILLRGNDKVTVLIDGKQNAITGFGNQSGLDNLPASAIERIEIINNPSAMYEANGNAGIINIIYKKSRKEGWNGRIGLSGGLGSLWVRRDNLPGIRRQYQATPKLNPSVSLNYRKDKLNTFLQADWLYTHTLNRNEFAVRKYNDGTEVQQQVKRNRNTSFSTIKTGIDWMPDEQNSLTVSGFFNREKIIDRGDIPYFNKDLSQRLRLWQFLEDEVKYTAIASAVYQHKYNQPGRVLSMGFNYTFHREDEKYFFTNIMPGYTGEDAFKLLSDEHVSDLNLDYVRPLRHGRIETGGRIRYRSIPTNMLFFPGLNSPIDPNAGGWATYREIIPALYSNYVYESNKVELEAGIRLEYVKVEYEVNPDHNTYTSDGYDYAQPFPNIRLAYKFDAKNKISFFYNRRVDRPNEVDIRIFPKYDEPELLKVGNPTLRPQFTNSFEIGYRNNWNKGSLYTSVYHKITDETITRIATIVPGNTLIYNIFQNAGKSVATGIETVWQQEFSKKWTSSLGVTIYRNTIRAFTVQNKYPVPTVYSASEENITSGNLKLNNTIRLPRSADLQLSVVYLAPDLLPQGKIESRFSIDFGFKKLVQQGKREWFVNATDVLGTLRIKRQIRGNGFTYNSTDYLESQVFRVGYGWKF